jgi:prepilin-type N-terminal cleavage/methylation domain-containing protein
MSKNIRRYVSGTEAFTLIELLMVILIIGVLSTIAFLILHSYTVKAYDVTIKYDLLNFVKSEEIYFAGNDKYFGTAGDFMVGGTAGGGLNSSEFSYVPSKGVRIEIISGDGEKPFQSPVFKAESSHERASVTYEYDFSTCKLIKKEK